MREKLNTYREVKRVLDCLQQEQLVPKIRDVEREGIQAQQCNRRRR